PVTIRVCAVALIAMSAATAAEANENFQRMRAASFLRGEEWRTYRNGGRPTHIRFDSGTVNTNDGCLPAPLRHHIFGALAFTNPRPVRCEGTGCDLTARLPEDTMTRRMTGSAGS